MSVSAADLAIPISGPFAMAFIAVSSALGLYFFTLKSIYGTYSLHKVVKDNVKRNEYYERYNQMFNNRDNFMYHIAAARRRGENDLALSLIKELKSLDDEIDELEKEFMLDFGMNLSSKPKADRLPLNR